MKVIETVIVETVIVGTVIVETVIVGTVIVATISRNCYVEINMLCDTVAKNEIRTWMQT